MSGESTQIVHNGGGWILNIGNAFIDLGSMHSLKQASDDVDIHLSSVFGRWMSHHIESGISNRLLNRYPDVQNAYDIRRSFDADYVIQAGACLSEHWFKTYGQSLVNGKEGGADIIIYGAGASENNYSEEAITKTRDWLKQLEPYAFISRDQQSYEAFADIAEHSYNGIDCGFFVADAFDPAPFDEDEYVAVNFDKKPEPEINTVDKKIARTHHSFLFNFALHKYPKMIKEYYGQENTLVSDVPDDYLNVYANAESTVSDRVHACVATYAFGNPARLVHETKRASLFERIGIDSISEEFVEPDLDRLQEEKKEQIDFMSEILE